ncbi:ATP-binding protein [uncultured Aquimarina sp.]|uniref:ATP-binding response regulator n=1 Tax=uncultured Aquimarina sp. TaxID=575652 RepID=UPI0026291ED5|nr:ATP-binding protein [uncultured Aquimarina sp.]
MGSIVNQEYRLKFQKNMQLIVVSFDGVIKQTDAVLFNWEEGNSIFDIHPFFGIIKELLKKTNRIDQEHTFPCVHFEESSKVKICDVTISIESTEVLVAIFEYTKKYQELTKIVQQKKETKIINRELELKHQFLEQKEEFKNSLIANINHQIKTPLTGIIGFTELLEKTKLSFDQEEMLGIIKRESKYLESIITDMLDISKIEAGTLEIKKENFDFVKLIDEVKERYIRQAKEKDIDFEVYLDENIPQELIGDPIRIQQILLNLLNNAFRYTKEGKISLKVTRNYQKHTKLSVNFNVSDTGQGIAEENLEFIFDRFTRFHEDKQVTGTGLGLTIVKNLVDQMEGTIKVISTINEGSSFSLNLPLKTETIDTQHTKKIKKYKLPKISRKFRVLLVEDKEVNQYLVMKLLISHGSFFVDTATNGKEAIKCIEKKKYDIILMDLMMSPMNGYTATHKIRNNYSDKDISRIPIIGFTAQNAKGEREKCLRSGMDDFINKPFVQEDLLNKIYKHISRNID